MGKEGDPQEIVQEIKFWLNEQVVYTEAGIRPEEWDAQTLWF